MKSDAISEQIREIETQRAPSQDLHLLDLLTVLSKRRKFIFIFTVVAAILTVITVLLIPSQYTATTVILPPSQSSSISSLLGQVSGSGGGTSVGTGALASLASGSLGIKSTGEMYVSLFHSRTVEDAMIQRFGLMARYHKKRMADARKKFEKRTTVALGAKDGLITVTVDDLDPRLAAEIANAYVDELRKLSASLAITEASQRRVFFQQQLLEARGNLTAAEEAMKTTQQTTGVLQIDSQAKALLESASILRGQAVAKEVQIQAMRSFATESNPELIMAKQQLAALQAQLGKLAGQDSGSAFIVPKGRAPEVGMEYLRKLRDLKYNETVFELIAKQFELAKLDEARQGALIQVADPAMPPDKVSFPNRIITDSLVTLLGFFVACGWCIFADGLKRMAPADRRRLDALRATFR
jgi:tyrosine-protein kinase Etk/Wzc